MKNYNYLVIASLITSALASSCSKDDNDNDNKNSTKKIQSYVTIEGSEKDSSVYIYNGDNQVGMDFYVMFSASYQKTYSEEMNYSGDKLIIIYSNTWVGNNKVNFERDSISYDSKSRPEKKYNYRVDSNRKLQLNSDPIVISYNDANQPTKIVISSDKYQTFEYDAAGNVTKVVNYNNNQISSTDNYTYDNKKNPIKGNPGYIGEVLYYSPNNQLTYSNGDLSRTFTYEYDSEGYPSKITMLGRYPSQVSETTLVTRVYYK